MRQASVDPDCYGNPGPEGPTFWAFIAFTFAVVFLIVVTSPMWPPGVAS